MKYTVREIHAGQIEVEFEDGSRAMVPIHPQATADQIDNAVSKYDRDFQPDPETLKNKNIAIGEERASAEIPINDLLDETKISPPNTTTTINDGSSDYVVKTLPDADMYAIGTFAPTVATAKVDFGLAHNVDVLATAQYLAENGDSRLKDALYLKVEKYISDEKFSLDEFINNLLFDPDDIVAQAEAELNG